MILGRSPAIALVCFSSLAVAGTYNYSGSLSSPNQAFEIVFTLTSTSSVTIQTTSWRAGNFDTVLWLFDSAGNQVQKNDDACNGVGCTPIVRDSLIQVANLAPGTYTAFLTSYDQHFWRAGAAGNPPGVLVTGWSYLGDFGGLPANYALSLTTSAAIAIPYTETLYPPSMTGPAAPSQLTPANAATGVPISPTVSWRSVDGTNGYLVYVGTNNPPTTSVFTTATSFTPSIPLVPSTTYYWKVASRDPNNNNTPNPSRTWSFVTSAPPPLPPALSSPGNGATGVSQSPALTWNPVANTAGYSVYLGTSNPPTTSTLVTGTSFTPASSLTAGTTYYWRVASRDPNTGAESPSAVWSFTTGTTVSTIRHRTITIDHTRVPNTDQANFPLLVSVTDPQLKTIGNGGHVSSGMGYDILFTSDAAGLQRLDFDIESYDPAAGQLAAWIRVPALSHVTDTLVYLSYGNSAITASQQNKAGVWTGYRAVYHMADHAVSNAISDSTGNHPAANVSSTSARTTSGVIASALLFDGSIDYATAPDAADLQSANVRTVSFWMRPNDLSGAVTARILHEYTDANNGWAIVSESSGNADFNTVRASMRAAGVESQFKIADNSLVTGGLYHVAVTFNGLAPSAMYLNGTSASLQTPKQGPLGNGSAARLTIAARNDNARLFAGVLDEIRIASVSRSADWIRTEYNNQSSPGTFYTLGAESPAGAAVLK